MTEQELRRLSRSDLLELLLAQRKENEQLRCMLDQAEARLTDRTAAGKEAVDNVDAKTPQPHQKPVRFDFTAFVQSC